MSILTRGSSERALKILVLYVRLKFFNFIVEGNHFLVVTNTILRKFSYTLVC